MKAVTTFSPEGYEKYGKRCLESLVEHWPSEIVVFYEEKPDFEHPKLTYRSLDEIPERERFLKLCEKVPESGGMTNGQYNFMRDAKKYCHKAFAQMSVDDDCVFWVDADTVAFKDVPEAYLRSLLRGVPFCYFGRTTYTETGFVGFNPRNQFFPIFRAQYLNCYLRGVIFSMLGWHDCFAFDFARMGIHGRNLSPNGQEFEHVIAGSEVGTYIDHLKGARKDIGHSPEAAVRWWE